jgi:hypothetical protein
MSQLQLAVGVMLGVRSLASRMALEPMTAEQKQRANDLCHDAEFHLNAVRDALAKGDGVL